MAQLNHHTQHYTTQKEIAISQPILRLQTHRNPDTPHRTNTTTATPQPQDSPTALLNLFLLAPLRHPTGGGRSIPSRLVSNSSSPHEQTRHPQEQNNRSRHSNPRPQRTTRNSRTYSRNHPQTQNHSSRSRGTVSTTRTPIRHKTKDSRPSRTRETTGRRSGKKNTHQGSGPRDSSEQKKK